MPDTPNGAPLLAVEVLRQLLTQSEQVVPKLEGRFGRWGPLGQQPLDVVQPPMEFAVLGSDSQCNVLMALVHGLAFS